MDTRTIESLASSAVNSSLFFWWVATLRCSKDYWWCCQQKGDCLDPRIVKVWNDFGDIFSYECFMHWWQDRGPKLFDSPQEEMKLKDLGFGVVLLDQAEIVKPKLDTIYLAIPKFLNTLQAQTILFEAWQSARVRGEHYTVSAKYQLAKLGLRSMKTIIPAYKSMMLNISVNCSLKTNKLNKWGDFEKGLHLNVSPNQKILDRDNSKVRAEKRNTVRNAFRKTLDSFNSLIGNVEVGVFPSKDPVQVCERWRPDQQQQLEQAVAQGQWHSEGWAKKEMAYMLPGIEIYQGHDHPHETFQILDHFSSLGTPFLEPKRKKTFAIRKIQS